MPCSHVHMAYLAALFQFNLVNEVLKDFWFCITVAQKVYCCQVGIVPSKKLTERLYLAWTPREKNLLAGFQFGFHEIEIAVLAITVF
jgi:hypothetical protein